MIDCLVADEKGLQEKGGGKAPQQRDQPGQSLGRECVQETEV